MVAHGKVKRLLLGQQYILLFLQNRELRRENELLWIIPYCIFLTCVLQSLAARTRQVLLHEVVLEVVCDIGQTAEELSDYQSQRWPHSEHCAEKHLETNPCGSLLQHPLTWKKQTNCVLLDSPPTPPLSFPWKGWGGEEALLVVSIPLSLAGVSANFTLIA